MLKVDNGDFCENNVIILMKNGQINYTNPSPYEQRMPLSSPCPKRFWRQQMGFSVGGGVERTANLLIFKTCPLFHNGLTSPWFQCFIFLVGSVSNYDQI